MRQAGIREYFVLRHEHPDWFANADDGFRLLSEEEVAANREHLHSAGIAYDDPDGYFIVLKDPVQFEDGHVGTYFRVIERPQAGVGAAVLPILDGRIVLLDIFRHATRQHHLEIPRGFSDPGDTPEQAAVKELREELGASIDDSVRSLGTLHTNTGALAKSVELFIATLTAIKPPGRHEGIRKVEIKAPAEVEALIASGDITDAFTLSAFLRARLKGQI